MVHSSPKGCSPCWSTRQDPPADSAKVTLRIKVQEFDQIHGSCRAPEPWSAHASSALTSTVAGYSRDGEIFAGVAVPVPRRGGQACCPLPPRRVLSRGGQLLAGPAGELFQFVIRSLHPEGIANPAFDPGATLWQARQIEAWKDRLASAGHKPRTGLLVARYKWLSEHAHVVTVLLHLASRVVGNKGDESCVFLQASRTEQST
jgi:hypothetical protein